ncbi:hypothetical protein [Roseibium album]|uniref:Uncharacterized protein n=1 Tax=Roseibium album TaxID=311410 RepID=A0A0M6Z7U3_9HYPH|nr:hypothetical protein [Roseibium album]CTQ58142.1 hypothetical protein LA5094_00899 [Roseibium album]CTQ65670.1 hypothetical protein LA5096_00810 [Roseibium album]CTQ70553.1 hypothetical protein LA5095_01954 [Roseibium album]
MTYLGSNEKCSNQCPGNGDCQFVASACEAKAWQAIADQPVIGCIDHLTTNFLLKADRADMTILVQNFRNVASADLAAFVRLGDEQVAKHPALLNRIQPDKLKDQDVFIGQVWVQGSLVAGAYGTRKIGPEGELSNHWSGLISNGTLKGAGQIVLAALILADEHWRGEIVDGEGVARVLPNDAVNVASSKTMMRLGYYAAQVLSHPVTLENAQKGLLGSAEPNGADLRYVLLRGYGEETADHARNTLSGWSVSFGAAK